ncbi:MAG: phosphoribosyltransferase family protein [Nitrospirota bacterium]
MAKINPKQLHGPWATGYALDIHSTGSEFIGYDEYGHEQFDTKRTEIGELLYRVKYQGDDAALDELVSTMADFIRVKRKAVDMIVPVPPTRARRVQPLFKIADALGAKIKTPVVRNAVKKTGGSELKNLHSYEERRQALEHVIMADSKLVTGKRILLLDDLVRSGATINAVAEQLTSAGATAVHVLAITQTRRQ